MNGQQSSKPASLTYSIIIAIVCSLFLSSSLSNFVIKPLAFDGTLSRSGRYGFVYEAWNTIGDDNVDLSIVAVGSSLTQYAINGSCMKSEDSTKSSNTYNLGIPGSYPYLDMVQMNRALSSKPDMVLLEVNPISLSQVSDISEINIQLRLMLASLFLHREEYIGWVEILKNEHLEYMDYYLDDRLNSENMFFGKSVEELLNRYTNNNSKDEWWTIDPHWYLGVPNPESDSWLNYLIEPPLLSSYIAGMDQENLSVYENETIPKQMSRERYKPNIENNLNLLALEYMVSTLSSNDIPIILVSYPIHPISLSSLHSNQLYQHNLTLDYLGKYDKVDSRNYIWSEEWEKDDFYDFEHLDEPGRNKLCGILGPDIFSKL